jgi:hypothetical protein
VITAIVPRTVVAGTVAAGSPAASTTAVVVTCIVASSVIPGAAAVIVADVMASAIVRASPIAIVGGCIVGATAAANVAWRVVRTPFGHQDIGRARFRQGVLRPVVAPPATLGAIIPGRIIGTIPGKNVANRKERCRMHGRPSVICGCDGCGSGKAGREQSGDQNL